MKANFHFSISANCKKTILSRVSFIVWWGVFPIFLFWIKQRINEVVSYEKNRGQQYRQQREQKNRLRKKRFLRRLCNNGGVRPGRIGLEIFHFSRAFFFPFYLRRKFNGPRLRNQPAALGDGSQVGSHRPDCDFGRRRRNGGTEVLLGICFWKLILVHGNKISLLLYQEWY